MMRELFGHLMYDGNILKLGFLGMMVMVVVLDTKGFFYVPRPFRLVWCVMGIYWAIFGLGFLALYLVTL